MADKNILGFVTTSTIATPVAKHYMTYSPRHDVKVNITPGENIRTVVAGAKLMVEVKSKR
jgi:hypothetical protein